MADELNKVKIRRSVIRERMNVIGGLEDISEAVIKEEKELRAEYQKLEVRQRAAEIGSEEADKQAKEQFKDDDKKGQELAELRSGVSLGKYLSAIADGRSPDGKEAELQKELGMGSNMIPHDAIEVRQASPVIEKRAVTPSPSDVGAIQHPIIPPVYAAGTAAFLGIQMPSVGVGESNYTVLSTGATPGTPAKDGEQAESDGVFSPFVMSPRRVQASFIFRREDAAVLAGMEESLRANLSGALTEALDEQVISAGAGLLGTGLTAPDNPGDQATFTDYVSEMVGLRVDGRYATGSDSLKVAVGPSTYAHMAAMFLSKSNESAAGYINRITSGLRVSAHVPDVAAKRQDAIVARGSAMNAVLPTWLGVTVIKDEVTKASAGQIVLTIVQLFGFSVLRADGFARLRFQVAE